MKKSVLKSIALRSCALAALGATIFWAPTLAQEVESIDPEATDIGDYGVQRGAFVFTPTIRAGALYNDNVRAVEVGGQEAWAGTLDASLGMVSTWRRHAFGALLSANALAYEEALDDDNIFNFNASGNARIDFGRSSNIFGNAGYSQLTEERGSANLPVDAVSPGDYQRTQAELGLAHSFTRTILSASAQARTVDYDDVTLIGGGVVDNDVRDFDAYALIGDVEREFRSGYAGFASLIYEEREYDDTAFVGGNSTGIEGRAGVRGALTDFVDGEAYIGYVTRDFDAASTVDGFVVGGLLDWTPTENWRVHFEGATSVDASNDFTAPSYISHRVELSIMRSVLRQLSLGPRFGYQRSDFQGSNREDDIFFLGLDGRYDLTRTVSIDAGYRYTDRDTTLVGGSFDQNRFIIGVTLRR